MLFVANSITPANLPSNSQFLNMTLTKVMFDSNLLYICLDNRSFLLDVIRQNYQDILVHAISCFCYRLKKQQRESNQLIGSTCKLHNSETETARHEYNMQFVQYVGLRLVWLGFCSFREIELTIVRGEQIDQTQFWLQILMNKEAERSILVLVLCI